MAGFKAVFYTRPVQTLTICQLHFRIPPEFFSCTGTFAVILPLPEVDGSEGAGL